MVDHIYNVLLAGPSGTQDTVTMAIDSLFFGDDYSRVDAMDSLVPLLYQKDLRRYLTLPDKRLSKGVNKEDYPELEANGFNEDFLKKLRRIDLGSLVTAFPEEGEELKNIAIKTYEIPVAVGATLILLGLTLDRIGNG